jgi:hypothetical protein
MKLLMKKSLLWASMLLLSQTSKSQVIFQDNFTGTVLNPKWKVINPNLASNIELDGDGFLAAVASPMFGGSDIDSISNFNAPRVYIEVDPKTSWVAETKVALLGFYDFSAAAMFVGTSKKLNDSASHKIIIAKGTEGIDSGIYSRCGHKTFDSMFAFLRIKYDKKSITSFYSQDSINWISTGCITTDSVYSVGLAGIRQAYDDDTLVFSISVFDYFKVTKTSSATDIDEVAKSTSQINMTIAPNPTKDFSTIQFESPDAAECTISTFNLMGQKLQELTVKAIPGKNNLSLDLSNLTPGSYYVRLLSTNFTGTKQIIKL